MKPEIIAAYRHALALHNDPEVERDDDKHQAYRQACLDLDGLLDLKPWDCTLMEVVDADEPPTWMVDDRHRASWLSARFLFEQFDKITA